MGNLVQATIRYCSFLIMAPGLFTAAFTLGVMMQVVNAW